MKIAIIHLAFIYSGGGERLVLEQAKNLSRLGHRVTIFTPVGSRKRCYPDIIDGFKFKNLLPDLPHFMPEWEVWQVLLACILAPFLAFYFKDFDIILAANQPSPWLAWWAKKWFKIPYIAYLAQATRFLHPRNIDMETKLIFSQKSAFQPAINLMKLSGPISNWADHISIRAANAVIANGIYTESVIDRIYQVKSVNCPAGAYPVTNLHPYQSRLQGNLILGSRKTVSKPYILLTNRHFPQKRFEYAITGLPVVLEKYPQYSLVITGEETFYTQDLKLLVKRLSMEKKVLFLGFVKEKDLSRLYREAAVYVYTAPEEDFGMGIIEAMACATPVVAWDNDGPKTIINHKQTGLLAKPYEVVDFADKICQLIANRRKAAKIGQAAQEKVKQTYSWKIHVQCILKTLRQYALKKDS